LSAQTSNHYLTRVRSFVTWMVDHERLPSNRLRTLKAVEIKTDLRRERGVLTPAEFGKLVETAWTAPRCRGLDGESRVALYVLASYTGLRVAELASLTLGQFNLAADPPTVTVRAGYTKNKQEAAPPRRGRHLGPNHLTQTARRPRLPRGLAKQGGRDAPGRPDPGRNPFPGWEWAPPGLPRPPPPVRDRVDPDRPDRGRPAAHASQHGQAHSRPLQPPESQRPDFGP
jgi:integrase